MTEGERSFEGLHSVLHEEDVQELIENRKIQPEDYSIIDNLSQFTKTELISNFHNFFLNHKEISAQELEADIRLLDRRLDSDPNNDETRRKKEMSEWYLELCRKYDWATAHAVNRVLERRNTHSEFSTIND